jgi:hypothetical protein
VTKSLDDLKAALFTAKDGVAACDAINKLSKLAEKGNERSEGVLADYVANGAISHLRVTLAHAWRILSQNRMSYSPHCFGRGCRTQRFVTGASWAT